MKKLLKSLIKKIIDYLLKIEYLRHGTARAVDYLVRRYFSFSAKISSVQTLDSEQKEELLVRLLKTTPYNKLLLTMLSQAFEVNSSFFYDLRTFLQYHAAYSKYKGSGRVPTAVGELGPGISGGVLQFFLYAGAKRAYSFDPFPHLVIQPDLYFELLNLNQDIQDALSAFDKKRREKVRFKNLPKEIVKGKQYKIHKGELLHSFSAGEKMDVRDATLDYAYSNAVLEHVIDPDSVVREIFRSLRKGGISAHQIDLRDHRDFSKPLEFLCMSNDEWEAELAHLKTGDESNHMNRWRYSSWVQAFKQIGFKILHSEINMLAEPEYVAALKTRLHEDYATLSTKDLHAISMFIVVEK